MYHEGKKEKEVVELYNLKLKEKNVRTNFEILKITNSIVSQI